MEIGLVLFAFSSPCPELNLSFPAYSVHYVNKKDEPYVKRFQLQVKRHIHLQFVGIRCGMEMQLLMAWDSLHDGVPVLELFRSN